MHFKIDVRLFRFREILHTRQVFEIGIERPDGCAKLFRSGKNNAGGKRQLVHDAVMGGTQRNLAIERHHLSLMQHGGHLQRGIFVALLHHMARDFHEHDRRNEQPLDFLNRGGNVRRMHTIGEVFEPRR